MRKKGHLNSLGPSGNAKANLATAQGTSPSHGTIRNEQERCLTDALERLPDRWRQAVILRQLHGRSLPDVVQAMNCSKTVAAGLVNRGLAGLRRQLVENTGS